MRDLVTTLLDAVGLLAMALGIGCLAASAAATIGGGPALTLATAGAGTFSGGLALTLGSVLAASRRTPPAGDTT